MKKSMLLFLLLPMLAVVSFAQESRQDVSISATGTFSPYVFGNGVRQTATLGIGGLVSYRYMLTPSNAVEGNYQYWQNYDKFSIAEILPNTRIHARVQEISAAYVHSFTFRKWNPFLEGGPAVMLFSPIETGSNVYDKSRTTNIGGLYGGGIAYEISPSFDIRAEYRGIVVKAPFFHITTNNTNRWYNISDPAVGVAYHF